MSYDAWLEKPFQDECDRADQYDAGLEAEAERLQEELLALPLSELLNRYGPFEAQIYDLLSTKGTQKYLAQVLNKPFSFTLEWDLQRILDAFITDLAEHNLATRPPEYDGPEPDDFSPTDLDY